MAELMFKRGLQQNLPAVAEDGCFYLTTDSNRLYVGQGSTMALLNQTVQIVDNIDILRDAAAAGTVHKNDFYYCVDENVLAVYNGTDWVQINPDTNTNDTIEVSEAEFSEGTVNNEKTEVSYTLTLHQDKYDVDANKLTDDNGNSVMAPITATLTLKTTDIADIIPEAAQVGLIAEQLAENAGVNILTDGAGSDPETLITLVPGENVQAISTDGVNVTIDVKDTTYDLTAVSDENDAVSVQLWDKLNSEGQNVYFEAGTDLEVTADSENNTITYSHAVYDVDSPVVNNDEVDLTKLNPGDTINIIGGFTLSNGHVSAVEVTPITLPGDSHLIDKIDHEEDSWQTTLYDNNNNSWVIDFSVDAANLEERLGEQIEKGLAAANTALTYKGIITHPSELDSKVDVEVGDVYLLSENVSDNDQEYRKGDLFIATSISSPDSDGLGEDEDFDGILSGGDLEWQYVPAGNEMIVDTLFKGQATVTGMSGIADTENNGSAEFHITAQATAEGDINNPEGSQSLTMVAGQGLEIVDNSDAGSDDKVATIRHKDITTEEATGDESSDAFSVEAVTGIEYENGHITKITKQTVNVATYELIGDSETDSIQLKDSAQNINGTIEVKGDDTWISAAVDAGADEKTYTLTVSHEGPGESTQEQVVTNDSELSAKGSLNMISGIHYDAKGHVTQVDTETLTLPDDTTYEFYLTDENGEKVADDAVDTPYLTLVDKNENPQTIQMYTEHQNLSVQGNASQVVFNLVWGTFE